MDSNPDQVASPRLTDGTPLVLLEKGHWRPDAMKGMRIADDDVMAMARDKELKTLDEIEYAILERNGEISIIESSEFHEMAAGK